MPGTIYDSKSLFLRESVGTAEDPETKIKYEMTTICQTRMPLICSGKTGKYFSLTWADILSLAIEAGIDKEGT